MRKTVMLRFLDEEGSLQHRKARILDIFSRGGAEFITIESGETLRLDRIEAVDDVRRVDY